MLFMDVKDFRNGSDYPVETPEESVSNLLEAAGCDFTTPLSVKVRLKDLDSRFILSKVELVENSPDSIRVNLYLPASGKPTPAYVARMNQELSHQFMHVVQTRKPREGVPNDVLEEEADSFAEKVGNKLTVVTCP